MKKLGLVLGMIVLTLSANAQWETRIGESKNDFGDVTLFAIQKFYIEGIYKETPIKEISNITRFDGSIKIDAYTDRDIDDSSVWHIGNIKIRDSKGNVSILDVDVITGSYLGFSVTIIDEDKIKAFNDAVFNCDDYKIVIGEGRESVLIEFSINETNNI